MKERNLNTPTPRGGCIDKNCQKIPNHAFVKSPRSHVSLWGVVAGLFDVARMLRACAISAVTAEPRYIVVLVLGAGFPSGVRPAREPTT